MCQRGFHLKLNLIELELDTWNLVCHSKMRQMSRPTLVSSITCKFRLSWNSTKFDMVARFRETIPMVKSVSSSEIWKNFGFFPKLRFCHFSENWNFMGSHRMRCGTKCRRHLWTIKKTHSLNLIYGYKSGVFMHIFQ